MLDADEAWAEEEFQELRVENILFRQIGPCQRCKATSLCPKEFGRSDKMEPYNTLVALRKHPKLGPLFGVYY